MSDFVLQFICPDKVGVLAAITQCLLGRSADIREAAQFGDAETGLFFVRMRVSVPAGTSAAELRQALSPAIRQFDLQIRCSDVAVRPRLLIAVSQFGHCLQQLLHAWRLGALQADIVGVVSNHETHRSLSEWHGVPFHYLPVTPDTKAAQEAQILKLIAEQRVNLLVLARYMQILSDATSRELEGRCINIHHSFLPGFKGAKPYHQAHARGVKLIGATAHYVTSDLDEGPIIEQDVRRVTHGTSPEEMVEIGRETEASVLARAVRWHVEDRVILNGHKTVVFA